MVDAFVCRPHQYCFHALRHSHGRLSRDQVARKEEQGGCIISYLLRRDDSWFCSVIVYLLDCRDTVLTLWRDNVRTTSGPSRPRSCSSSPLMVFTHDKLAEKNILDLGHFGPAVPVMWLTDFPVLKADCTNAYFRELGGGGGFLD